MSDQWRDPSSSSKAQKTRPKLHLIYFSLAAFDLLTVSLGLYLINRIMNIYTDSVQVNQVWANRLGDYSQLSRLAVAVNAPGNDVFYTRDVDAESARLEEVLKEFNNKFSDVRRDLTSVDEFQAATLLQACDATGESHR